MSVDTKKYKQLFISLKERYGKPVNKQVICAALEASGIRDIDVPIDYGFKDLDTMATHIYNTLLTFSPQNLKNDNQKQEESKADKTFYISDYAAVKYKLFLKDFGNGIFHLLPIFFQLLAIILLGFSLWTYVGFNNLQATAVVMGLILGLTATGGTIQAMGKQVAYYWYQDDNLMCEKMVRSGIKNGFLLLNAFAFLLLLINYVGNLYPIYFSGIVYMYAVSIGSLLLVLAPLYTIKKRWVISIAVLLGTVVAVVLLLYTTLSIYTIHCVGIIVSLLFALGYLYYFFRRKKIGNLNWNYGTPKKVVGLVRNSNYFIYGTLFYIFLFADRIIAWSTTNKQDLPFIIYYDKDYEIGMDLAMLVFFLMAGILEYSISSFSRNLERKKRILHHNQAKVFQTEMFQFYKKHLFFLLLNALIAAAALYYLVTKPWGYEAGFQDTLEPLSLFVAGIGCIGYIFLTIGILNVLLQHTLNQSIKPIKSLLVALIVNITVGVLASRFISFEYSAFGLLAGSAVFMVLTTRDVTVYFKNLAYHYYATI